jgi:hypothetical protein
MSHWASLILLLALTVLAVLASDGSVAENLFDSRPFETLASVVSAQKMVVGMLGISGIPKSLPSVTIGNLNAALAGPLGNAVGRPPWLVQTTQSESSSRVTFAFWYNGSNAQAAASAARALVTSSAGSSVKNALSAATLNAVGVSPQSIDFSADCGYSASAVSCGTSLTLSITMDVAPPASLLETICSALAIDYCEMVTLVSSVGPTLTGTYVAVVYIPTLNPAATLAAFVLKTRSASQLSMLSISLVQVFGVTVFTVGDLSVKTTSGSMSECVGRQWYLLFLILLAPVSYIVIRWCYNRGKIRGVDIAREQFEDLKVKTANTIAQQQPPQVVYYEQPPQQFIDASGVGGGYLVGHQEMYGGVPQNQQPQI